MIVTRGNKKADAAEVPELLDVRAVAEIFSCSQRFVIKMADQGVIPRPLKIGRLRRWSRRAIAQWAETQATAGGARS